MNLILCEAVEVAAGETSAESVVRLSNTDRRYVHCTTILKVDAGAVCRLGVIGGDMFDATIVELSSESITFTFSAVNKRETPEFADLNISLILAMPRPKVLDRLFPVFSQLGFRRVMLINAERVENAYFHTHVILESNSRPKLSKGLEQAAVSTRLPEVSIDKRPFETFLTKRLDVAFPPESCNRFICDPARPDGDTGPAALDLTRETVIALGPEGGWLDCEVMELRSRGFIPVTCSSRIFTTDVALIALTAAVTSRLNPVLLGGHI